MENRAKLIDRIVDMELEMYLSVPADGDYSCRQHLDSFRLHRKAQFNIWSKDTLQSYLNDLQQAAKEGRNLMTIKYARMDDLIPRENNNPLIEEIAAIQYRWQQEMFDRYPELMAGARPLSRGGDSAFRTSFETYLKGELETYSDATLSLLHRDLSNFVQSGMNGSQRVYEFLVRELGYGSIGEASQAQQKRMGNEKEP